MTLTGCINVAYHCDWHIAKPEEHVFHFVSGPFLWLPLSLLTNASQLRNCALASAKLLPYVLTILTTVPSGTGDFSPVPAYWQSHLNVD